MATYFGIPEEKLLEARYIEAKFQLMKELAALQNGNAAPIKLEPDDSSSDAGWMNSAEAAKYMKVSERTVGLWAKSGRLLGKKTGRRWKFKKSACDRAVKKKD